ncbi:gephyrin-like molybdotransferase Glp [Alkalihalobacillus trypoxylicola]|uniref:Molybdopterin molybdenumtransferase n=1 Tax=Alkalihalobacillus trypoxylicola TaxID=519424 RepID=A0A161Q767_9BACI|nr:gephyrin-like molybdotransferase Glp [Alkalihalobacillus trypoxylicola]KYG32318.1 molybdopterin molybdenumtransferase [Alkalihalobacillus trypoxylicola]
MIELRTPIQVKEAVKKVLALKKKEQSEFVLISDCDNRYLAEDILADHDVPPFTRSKVDGFAVRSIDTQDAAKEIPSNFSVIEEIGAGTVAKNHPQKGEAIRIMTGAQLPIGTDCVVMLEHVLQYKKKGSHYFQLEQELNPGMNVSYQGEDLQKGSSLIKKGRRITPGIMSLLATFGYNKVSVYKKPKIGIIATGTELLEVEQPLQPGKIRNSNSYMVASQIRKMGAEPILLGQLVDDLELSYQYILEQLKNIDYLITTGGVSVGDYDLLPEIYQKLGANVLFNKVQMRPGSVTTVAEWNGKALFGLSGNPSACYVGLEFFVRPLILESFSNPYPHLEKVQAILLKDELQTNVFTRFIRGFYHERDGKLFVQPIGLDQSHAISSLAEANSLIIVPANQTMKKNDIVEVLLLEGRGSEWPWR